MLSKRVFLMTASCLTSYQWHGDQRLEVLQFGADEDGLTRFATYLDRDPAAPTYLLTDLVEEEFREETVPHVYGRDRRAVVERKKNRLFRDPRYSQAIFQGRENDGRKDDRVLFTALTRPDLLLPWVSQITRRSVPLVGIYSLPALSQALLKRIPVTATHALLVTLQRAGGLRQTFFRDRQLKVSRLALMPSSDPVKCAGYVLAEVEKVRRYLNSVRLLAREQPLEVYLLSHGAMLRELEKEAVDTIHTRFQTVDAADIVRTLGAEAGRDSPYADLVFARLLVRESPANHYASPLEKRYYTMSRVRRAMTIVSVFALVASVLWSGFKFAEGVLAGAQTVAVREQTEFYGERYRIAKDGLPTGPAAAADIRKAVEMVAVLQSFRTSPAAAMEVLSKGLAPFPELKIDRLLWRSSTDPNAAIEGTEQMRARGNAGSGPQEAALFQLARVAGRVEPFDGNYRRAIDMVNRFADGLERLPSVADVRVLSLPLALGPDQRLEGTEVKGGEAAFELRVVLDATQQTQQGATTL
jgi:hypothetical protein